MQYTVGFTVDKAEKSFGYKCDLEEGIIPILNIPSDWKELWCNKHELISGIDLSFVEAHSLSEDELKQTLGDMIMKKTDYSIRQDDLLRLNRTMAEIFKSMGNVDEILKIEFVIKCRGGKTTKVTLRR